MAIGPLPPVINEIQANSGQPGKTLARPPATGSLLDLQVAAPAEPVAAIRPETTLIEKAVAEALGHQGGLAPLYATLAELAEAPDLPEAVKAAINMVLAFRLGDGDVTPERVAEAIRSSGLFHEAVAAGKMAAVLPPAVRQALGGTLNERRLATTRPVQTSAPMTSASSATPAPSTPPTAPSFATAPPSAAQAYGGQVGSTAETAAPAAPAIPQTSAAGSAAGSSSGPTAPAASTSASPIPGPTAPLASAAAPAIAASASPPATAADAIPQAAASLTASPPTPSAPGSTVPQVGPAPLPAPVFVTDGEGASPATPTVGVTAPPASVAPVSLATALPSGPAVSAGGPVSPSPPGATSGSPETGAPASPVPPVSPTPAHAAAPSRSFAPWTPGRPMTPATPAAPSASADSPADTGHPPPFVTPGPNSGETTGPRPVGDHAPFVPAAVENLPDVAPTPARATVGSATPPAASDSPVPAGSTQFAMSTSSAQTPSPAAGARPEPTGLQARPAVASGAADVSTASALQKTVSPPAGLPPMAGVDLKGALDVLRRELIVWLGRNADVMASLDGAGDDGGTPRVDRPVPPRKGGPVRGQAAVPFLDGDEADAVSTETLAGRALGEAERSLSRVFLHQAATADSRDVKVAQSTPTLMFEIPIAGPNGTSVAQLRIEREDHAPNEPGGRPRRVFQVDIAFDVAPLGPVAVRVGLMDGRRVAVGVWCESDDGLVRMEAERENIVLGLEQEGMVVAGVDLHRGHPPENRDDVVATINHRLDLQL